MKYILITGATGFVGINIVCRLLEENNTYLYLLARDAGTNTATTRMHNILKTYYADTEEFNNVLNRIEIISGDITEDKLGISNDKWNELSQKINIIYHSAATIHFNLPYNEAYQINVLGTKRVLNFAEQCYKNRVLQVMNHISTAYVGGKIFRTFFEHELSIGQEFANTYEKTKFEAEILTNEYINRGLPIIVYRPSIIAGNSISGVITKGAIIFEFINQFSTHTYKEFICNEDSSLNIIPIDYLIEAMIHISMEKNNTGKTFHVINKNNTNIRSMVTTICKALNVATPLFISIDNQNHASKYTKLLLYTFINYIEKSHVFDDSLATKALNNSNIICERINADYFVKIVSYCQENKLLKGALRAIMDC